MTSGQGTESWERGDSFQPEFIELPSAWDWWWGEVGVWGWNRKRWVAMICVEELPQHPI